MPFFDPISVPPKAGQKSSIRRWLAWFAIPLATGFTWLAESGKRDGGLDSDGKAVFIWFGMLAGGACILLSRPRDRSLKWTFFILYAIVMVPIFTVIDFMFNGISRLF